MTVTARQEFEGLEPWQVITGSSFGGWTDREMVCEIIKACITLSSDSGTADRLWPELAGTADDDIDVNGWTDELTEIAADVMPLFTSLTWRDNELTVLPYLPDDNECYRTDQDIDRPADIDHEEKYHYISVNDHGNATLHQWNDAKQCFTVVWEMV